VKSGVLCHSSSVLLCMGECVVHWKVKVASSLTDVWQQLFQQQDITVICTVHFHPWQYETTPLQQNLDILTETELQEHDYHKPVRDVYELKQHLIETWSATSRATSIK